MMMRLAGAREENAPVITASRQKTEKTSDILRPHFVRKRGKNEIIQLISFKEQAEWGDPRHGQEEEGPVLSHLILARVMRHVVMDDAATVPYAH